MYMDNKLENLKRSLLILILSISSAYASDYETLSKECRAYLNWTEQYYDEERLKASSHLKRSFLWENDSFLTSKDEDRHYTNGMKLTWVDNPCRNESELFKNMFKNVLNTFSFDFTQIYTGGVFGMNMYTPNDLSDSSRNTNDRPYAGWMYGGLILQSRNTEMNKFHSIEIDLGFIGPVAGQGEVQTWVHDHITDSEIPLGWKNQIGNKIGINLQYLYRQNFGSIPMSSGNNLIRLVPHTGFSIGNVVNYINIGGLIIIGKSGLDLPALMIQPVFTPDVKIKRKIDTELYFFAGIDYRYYGSSIFIEGKGDSSHDIDIVPNVYDLMLGISYKPRADYRISYKIIDRSEEFDSNVSSFNRSHRIGQFNIEWFF